MSLHRSVREGIAAIRNGQPQQQQPGGVQGGGGGGGTDEERDTAAGQCELLIRGRRWEQPLNLHSIQHLVNFLRESSTTTQEVSSNNNNNITPIKHLKLHAVTIQNRNGELNVLRDYLMECKLTKVTIMGCTLGRNADDVERLLSAFYPPRNINSSSTSTSSSSSIVHLDFWRLSHLQGQSLGRCLALILNNNHTLQKLECWGCPSLGATGVAAMQSALQSSNRGNLLELNLAGCNIGNDGLTCLATALAENPHSALQVLNISGTNQITIHGIEHGIIRLATCEHLRKIDFGHDVLVQVLRHAEHSWQLARVLLCNLYLQKLTGITHANFPDCQPVVSAILGILARNKLLAPQSYDTNHGELLDSNSGIWSMALFKFAQQTSRRDGDNVIHSPATCVFQILQRRPFLVPYVQQRQQQHQQPEQKESPPPPPPTVAIIPPPPPRAAREENSHPNENDNDDDNDDSLTRTGTGNAGPNKRARLA